MHYTRSCCSSGEIISAMYLYSVEALIKVSSNSSWSVPSICLFLCLSVFFLFGVSCLFLMFFIGDPISDRIAVYCNDLMSCERRTTYMPLSLDRFPPNFPRTRVQAVARDIWFHIPEKFPLRGRICRKTLLGYPICDQDTGYGKRSATPTLFSLFSSPIVDIPQMCLTLVTFAEGCTVYQLSTSDSHPLPQYQQWRYRDAYHFLFQTHSPGGATDRIADLHWLLIHCTFSIFIHSLFITSVEFVTIASIDGPRPLWQPPIIVIIVINVQNCSLYRC